MTDHVRRLAATANGQHGAFSTEQAHDSEVPDHVLRGWTASGLLSSTGVRTHRAATSPPSPLADLAARSLDVRPHLLFSHGTAAALHGFDGFALRPPYHATVARGSFVKRPDLVVHTSTATGTPDAIRLSGLNVMSPARTIIDLSPRLNTKRLTIVIDGAIRDQLTTEEEMFERIAALRSQGRKAIPKLIEVMDGVEPAKGGHSWLERRFLELLASNGMRRPATQQVVGKTDCRVIRVDCRFPGTPLVVELLGYRWHRTRAQLQRDAERMNRMILDGLIPLQFTYDDVVDRPGRCLRLVADTLERFV